MNKIAVIGVGKMGEALIRGMLENGIKPSQIGIMDKVKEKIDSLQKGLKVKPINKSEMWNFSIIIMAVKPQDMRSALEEYNSYIKKGSLLLSIAAGIKLSNLKEWTGRNDIYFARAMPNVGAMVRNSITAIFFEKDVPEELKKSAINAFKNVGRVYEVEREELVDIHTCIGGSAPAVVAVFLRALEDSGVLLGLKRENSVELAIEVVKAVVKLRENELSFENIKDMVTSPGGTTIEALRYLERKGLRGIVMEAFGKAFDKVKKLGG